MNHPVNIQRPVQSRFTLCIGVRFPAESSIATAKRTVESLAMVGMDCLVFDILHGFRMLGTGSHVLGTLSTFFVRSLFFILAFVPFLSILRGRPLLSVWRSSWQISNRTSPYLLSPSVIKVRSPVLEASLRTVLRALRKSRGERRGVRGE